MRLLFPFLLFVLASALGNTADICFLRHLDQGCDLDDQLPYICCEDVPSGTCCQNDSVPGFCKLMYVAGFKAENPTVNFYKDKNCKGLFDDCTMDTYPGLLQSSPANCCSGPEKADKMEYLAGKGELKVCSANWVAEVDTADWKQKIERRGDGNDKLMARGVQCRRPDVIKYADERGINRTITTDPDKVWRVLDFIDRREWAALHRWYHPQQWH